MREIREPGKSARARRRASRDPQEWSYLAASYATDSPPRPRLARKWYAKAARAGNAQGLFEYGLMLIQGEGGSTNGPKGRRLLMSAAAAGEIGAIRILAAAYELGTY